MQAALTHRVTVLTGGPGTGKTTTVRTIIGLCNREHKRVLLAAPTGRAAKRLAETTGEEAKTIHRLLEFKPAEGMAFQRNEENPLEGDLLIVDEASMLDLPLTNHLLKAVPPGMHLLLVGDVDQLPSVGAGNVLKDVIAALEDRDSEIERSGDRRPSSQSAVIRLQTIFRQAAGSYIITNAHRINAGEMPVDRQRRGAATSSSFNTEQPERAAELCVELVTERIPRRFRHCRRRISRCWRPCTVAWSACRTERCAAEGAQSAGSQPCRTQASATASTASATASCRCATTMTRMSTTATWGTSPRSTRSCTGLIVTFDGRPVAYDFLEMDELTHAYAVSVHKSQGSEFPAVVLPLLTTHYMMLQRNLLYTAVTRARRLVVIVGQPRAISLAVRNNDVMQRYTGLTERLLAGDRP